MGRGIWGPISTMGEILFTVRLLPSEHLPSLHSTPEQVGTLRERGEALELATFAPGLHYPGDLWKREPAQAVLDSLRAHLEQLKSILHQGVARGWGLLVSSN